MYTFAQHRQLPVLAPHIPIGIMAPTLRRQAYEMVRWPCFYQFDAKASLHLTAPVHYTTSHTGMSLQSPHTEAVAEKK